MEIRDLKRQYQRLKADIDQAMVNVAASGGYIMGTPVKTLERELADYVGVKHCLTCGNGTDALTLALKTWGVGAGDAVFVPDFTFFASAEVVALEGATPVFVDVDPKTYNIDLNSLEKAIAAVRSEGELLPKAVVAVDLFGLPANHIELRAIADRNHLYILEDGAQGFGGSLAGQRACSFGDIATTSFFPAKPLGCYGDGGALFTNNDEWAQLIESYRVHGKGNDKYDNVRIGLNSRLDTLQAAILQVKFKAFRDHELNDVNQAARRYHQLLAPLSDRLTLPITAELYISSWAQYTIQLAGGIDRSLLQAALNEQGIPTMVYYPKTMSQQSAFAQMRHYVDTPHALRLCHQVLALPIHPYITAEEQHTVSKALQTAIQ